MPEARPGVVCAYHLALIRPFSGEIKAFNDQFGNIDWKDDDKIRKVIAEEIPAKVAADAAYQNAMKNNVRRPPELNTTPRCSAS